MSTLLREMLALLLLSGTTASMAGFGAQPEPVLFMETAAARGVTGGDQPDGMTLGLAVRDFDDDGDLDLLLPTETGVRPKLWVNDGNGHFEDRAEALGLDDLERSRAALWIDADGDGRQDLLLFGDCHGTDCSLLTSAVRLWRQTASGTFAAVTVNSGLALPITDDELHMGGAAIADLDGDRDLDIVFGFWIGRAYVYLNDGQGRFVERSAELGVEARDEGHWQVVILDLDGDGLQDLYWAIDFAPNRYFRQVGGRQSPKFQEQPLSSGCANDMNDMGLAVADLMGTGRPNIFVSNIFRPEVSQYNVLLSVAASGCTEWSALADVRDTGWGWGATFADFNLDGVLSLAVANGFFRRPWFQPTHLLQRDDRNSAFTTATTTVGLTDTYWSSATVAADVDNDGSLELLQTQLMAADESRPAAISIKTNTANPVGRSLVVNVRHHLAPHDAVGAKVTVVGPEANRQTRWLLSGDSMSAQSPMRAHFGLDDQVSGVAVVVEWPDGTRSAAKLTTTQASIDIDDRLVFRHGFE